MEIQDLINNNGNKNINLNDDIPGLNNTEINNTEIKKLLLIKGENSKILNRLKHVEELFNNTIESLIIQVNKKKIELDNFNNMFMENNKHLKYILTNLSNF